MWCVASQVGRTLTEASVDAFDFAQPKPALIRHNRAPPQQRGPVGGLSSKMWAARATGQPAVVPPSLSWSSHVPAVDEPERSDSRSSTSRAQVTESVSHEMQHLPLGDQSSAARHVMVAVVMDALDRAASPPLPSDSDEDDDEEEEEVALQL
jgi:hypothetical protein